MLRLQLVEVEGQLKRAEAELAREEREVGELDEELKMARAMPQVREWRVVNM